MKVWKRVLIKVLIFLLIVGIAGFGGIAYKESGQSGSDDILSYYAEKLIANEQNRAYACLDNSRDVALTEEEFTKAAEAKKYSMYASYKIEKLQNRQDEDGTEYDDYKLTFLNSAEEVQAEETVSVVKEKEKRFFFFDDWRVLPDHCMVQDYTITVPAGSTLYLNGKPADASWIVADAAGEQYRVPSILPGSISILVQNPALEDLSEDADTTAGNIDLCSKMKLNEGSKAACLEIGVKTLKDLYSASVKGDSSKLSADLYSGCRKAAETFVNSQKNTLSQQEDSTSQFVSIAVSGFNPRYAEPVYGTAEKGGIQMELSLTYHYLGKFQTTVWEETGEYDENGDPITTETTQDSSQSGDATAKLTMSYQDGTWKLTEMEVPEIFE
ncbi:MAG: hypothetical protein PHR92_05645 [Lachnospiraceae bacterium]|nr:hypothetical protein [Lachnospiraceae bacterium]